MANPQLEDGYMRIANSIYEAIMQRDFTKRQRKILDLIIRLSYGCNHPSARIPLQRSFECVGLAETHISTELKWLVSAKVITIDGDEYAFNKNFEEWQLSLTKPYKPEELTNLVSLNLNGA